MTRADLLAVMRDAALEGRDDVIVALRAQLADLDAAEKKARPYSFGPPTLEEVIGKTMRAVTRDKSGPDNGDRILFESTDGTQWEMVYEPDCCAGCDIEDIVGELEDLVGAPIAMAEESANSDNPKQYAGGYTDESSTWTFYKFAIMKGYVTIRWYGSSNGYYSESASFRRVARR